MKSKGFNNFIIDGDVAIIEMFHKGQPMYTKVDAEDIPKLIELGTHWCASSKIKAHGGYYAQGMIKINGKNETQRLDIFVLDIIGQNIWHIDHKNGDSLDNRKNNLRKATIAENDRNRKGKNINNKSGHRNVCRIDNKWVVQLQINGKNTRLKSFSLDKLEEAGKYAEEMRQKYYGEYAGKG